jgi:polar amino acid transport system substrate-binding protein
MRTTTRRRVPAVTAAGAAAALLLAACGTGTAGDPVAAAPVARAAPAALLAAPPTCDDGKSAVASFDPKGTVAQLASGVNVQRIRSRGRLIVGTSGDVLLWGSRDPRTGQLAGFDIALAREIATAIFGDRPNTIEFRVINYAQRLPAVSGGKARQEGQLDSPEVDLVLHTMTINCDRWEQIAFSAEYYGAGQKLMVRADDPVLAAKKERMQIGDLAAGTKVCVPGGSTNEQLLEAEYGTLEAVPVPEIGECLVKFQRGEVSAITGDDTVLAGFAAQDPYGVIVGAALSEEPYGIGISAGQPDLVRFVNAVLDQVKSDGRWDRIYMATMGRALGEKSPPEPPPPSLYERP